MLDSVKSASSNLFDSIDETFNHFAPVKRLAERTNLRPSYFLLTFLILTLVLLGSGIFSHLTVTLFGMIYPSYMTFKALETKNSQKTKEWLTYWIVFGFFTAFARTVRYAFFFLSLSSYNVFRVLFYLYLFHPRTNGAANLYNNYLKGKLQQAENYLAKRQ